jgi:hypothetical protein
MEVSMSTKFDALIRKLEVFQDVEAASRRAAIEKVRLDLLPDVELAREKLPGLQKVVKEVKPFFDDVLKNRPAALGHWLSSIEEANRFFTLPKQIQDAIAQWEDIQWGQIRDEMHKRGLVSELRQRLRSWDGAASRLMMLRNTLADYIEGLPAPSGHHLSVDALPPRVNLATLRVDRKFDPRQG